MLASKEREGERENLLVGGKEDICLKGEGKGGG